MYLVLFLIVIIFGWKQALVTDKVVHKTTSASVVHIASAIRAQEVFSLSNKCLDRVERDVLLYQLAGKIFYKRNGLSTYGYIDDKDGTN